MGATNESYIRFGVGKAEAGVYELRLSNPWGAVTMEPVRISVLDRTEGDNLIPNPGFEVMDPSVPPTDLDRFQAVSWTGGSYPSLWSYPEKVPLNPYGQEDVLQGTNDAGVYGVAMDLGDGVRIVQQSSLEAPLIKDLEPGARYEFTGWFSRADASVTPDPGVEVSLGTTGGRRMSLGTAICTNSIGWIRMRTTLIPGANYGRIRLVGTRGVPGGEGLSGVYVDQLALRRITSRAPEFAAVGPILLPPWEALTVTQMLKPESLTDIRDDPFRFALGQGAPSGAGLDAVSGRMYWLPRMSEAGTERAFEVTVGTQSGIGPLATNRLSVRVQEGVQLELGVAWANRTERGAASNRALGGRGIGGFLESLSGDRRGYVSDGNLRHRPDGSVGLVPGRYRTLIPVPTGEVSSIVASLPGDVS